MNFNTLDQYATFQFSVTVDKQVLRKYILLRDGNAQVCEDNIGYDVDVYLAADVVTLAEIWFGERSVSAACEQRRLKVTGTTYHVDTISKWLGTSQFAPYNSSSATTTRQSSCLSSNTLLLGGINSTPLFLV